MNLLLLEAGEFREDGSAELTDRRARHLLQVLRVAAGSTVRMGVIDGPVGIGAVTDVSQDRVAIRWVQEEAVPERPRVDLLLALPRPKVLRRLLPHVAALGVGRILLTNASKVERDYFDSHYVRPEGFRPLLIEGLEQARDTRVPTVTIHRQFRKLVEDEIGAPSSSERRLLAHPGLGRRTVRQALRRLKPTRVLLAVGPEGGWNNFERERLGAHGFQEVALGARPLATTTAVIALLTLVHDGLSAPPRRQPLRL